MDKGKYSRYINMLLLGLVLTGIFLTYSSPMGTGDAWWHLNSGRWIVEHRMLPSVDHFTYTASAEPSLKKTFILQSYWLSQSLMYLIYKAAGLHGLVAAKALVFALMFFVLYLCLRTGGIGPAVSALLVAPAAVLLRGFGEARPQVLSFLMCITVFYLLEKSVRAENARTALKFRIMLLLSMALWSNLHGGFVVGIGMIGVYMASMILRVMKDGGDSRREHVTGLLWMLGAILAAGLNPRGFEAILVTYSELGHSPFVTMIDEYMPTLEYLKMTGRPGVLAGMATLVLAISAVMALSFRRIRLEHIMLLLIFGYAAYGTYRFSIFFALIGVAVAGQYLKGIIPDKFAGGRTIAWAAQGAAMLTGVWMITMAPGSGNLFRGVIDTGNTPEGGVSTIRASGLPKEVFNPYEWGGYIGWRLYPDYPVFVDGRTIDLPVQLDYQRAKDGDLKVLEARGVNTVIFYTLKPMRFGSGVPGVVLALLRDPSWGLVHFDDISAVFARLSALKRRTMMLGKELLWGQLEERLGYWAEAAPSDHRPHAELGALYAARGMREKALASLNRSLSLKPGNAEAMGILNRYGMGTGAE